MDVHRKPLVLKDGGMIQLPGDDYLSLGSWQLPFDSGSQGQLLASNGGGPAYWNTVPVGNLLINGMFHYFQRQAMTTLTSVSDDTYGPDRWNILTETAAIQVVATAADANAKTYWAGRLKQNQSSAQRMGLLQIVEAVDSRPLRGSLVTFQARVNHSASANVRIAILEWTGGADAVTSDVVQDWTKTDYTGGAGASKFFLNSANLIVTAIASFALTGGTAQDISVTGTVSTSCNNLIAFIWTEATAAQNSTLDVTEAGLYLGGNAPLWTPRPLGQEYALCQRYYEKSHDLLDAPTIAQGWAYQYSYAHTASLLVISTLNFAVKKRVAPVWHSYAWYTGNIDKVCENGGATDRTYISFRTYESGVQPYSNTSALTVGTDYYYNWTADAEM